MGLLSPIGLALQSPVNAAGGGWISGASNRKSARADDFALTAQNVSAYKVNGRVFVDGVKYTTLNAALADSACTNGCIIDMSGNASGTALALDSVDWGSRPITLLLGPYTYTTSHIVLHSDSHIIGAGMGQSVVNNSATIIQCTSTTEDCITLSQTDQPVQHVLLEGFRVYAARGNVAKGFYASAPANLGLWYSTFRNVCVGACGPGLESFHGGNLVFEAIKNGGVNQFLDFYNVQAFRGSATGHDLDLRGNNAQFLFNQCEFDGPAGFGDGKKSALDDDGGVNIWIGDYVSGPEPHAQHHQVRTAHVPAHRHVCFPQWLVGHRFRSRAHGDDEHWFSVESGRDEWECQHDDREVVHRNIRQQRWVWRDFRQPRAAWEVFDHASWRTTSNPLPTPSSRGTT